MKKLAHFKIIAILFISLALLLICHVHPHTSWDGDDDHCLSCQILQSGFVYVSPLILSMLFILVIIIPHNQTGVFETSTPSGYANRAPPTAFF